jgi:hypothetical protein
MSSTAGSGVDGYDAAELYATRGSTAVADMMSNPIRYDVNGAIGSTTNSVGVGRVIEAGFHTDRAATISETLRCRTAIHLVPWEKIELGTAAQFLVRDILPLVGLIVVYGPPKCGKTFFVFDLVMHVALGWKYRDKDVQQGAVVYCLFEGQRNFAARKEAFRQRHLADYGELVPFYLVPIRLKLVQDHPQLIDAINREIGGLSPRAVVIDTLNRSFSGDENATQAMTDYVAACDAIRETFACATIIVHHSGLQGGRSRGSTVLLGAADTQIGVKKLGTDHIEAVVEYMKDGSDGHRVLSRLEVIDVGVDEHCDPITSCVIVPIVEQENASSKARIKLSANEQTMLSILREAGPTGLSTEEWNERGRTEDIGVKRRATFFDIRRSLKDKGLICEGIHGWFVKR